MPRRLTVVQLLPALESGGVERSTLEIAEALVGAGHRALVVSAGGRLLANSIARESAAQIPGFSPTVSGMRLPVLRETRMPAVLITLGDVQRVVDHVTHLVAGVVAALESWAQPQPRSASPVDDGAHTTTST